MPNNNGDAIMVYTVEQMKAAINADQGGMTLVSSNRCDLCGRHEYVKQYLSTEMENEEDEYAVELCEDCVKKLREM